MKPKNDTRTKWSRIGFIAVLTSVLMLRDANANNPPVAWTYHAWWLAQIANGTALKPVDRVLFFELKVDPIGEIIERNGWPERWTDLRASLAKSRVPLDLTLTLLKASDFQSVFGSANSTKKLLEQASSLVKDPSVAGLHLDFEVYVDMPVQTQTRFNDFLLDLANVLHQQSPRKVLSVFLPIGGVMQMYEHRGLAKVDYVIAQGYDAHWADGPKAGPVAPLDGTSNVTWKKAVAQALALGVKRENLLISYPFFGYEWPTADRRPHGASRGAGITTTFAPVSASTLPAVQVNVQQRIAQYGSANDGLSGSSYYQFKHKNQWVTGWYEGEWALSRKFNYIRAQKLAGMAFFVAGYDGDKLLDAYLEKRSAHQKSNAKGLGVAKPAHPKGDGKNGI
jgi:spore germination protein